MVNELQEALSASFQAQMNNIYTAIPCVVVSVAGPSRVNIQPSVNQKMKAGGVKERPVILEVPISFPVSKSGGMTFPISPGDTGIAVFSMRSIEAWKSGDGYPSTPLNFAKMDKNDAMFIPGIQPQSTSANDPSKHSFSHSTSDTVMFAGLGTANETEVRLQPSGNILIKTNKDVSVECDNANITANTSASITTPELSLLSVMNLTVDAQNTTWSGNVAHTGTFTFNSIPFATHKHTGVQTGTGTSGTPVP